MLRFPFLDVEKQEIKYRKRWHIIAVKMFITGVIICIIFMISSLIDFYTQKDKPHPSYDVQLNYTVYGARYSSRVFPMLSQSIEKLIFIKQISYQSNCGEYFVSDDGGSSFVIFENITFIGCYLNTFISYHINQDQKENYRLAYVDGFTFGHKYDKTFVTTGEYNYYGDIEKIKTEEWPMVISGTNDYMIYIACSYNHFVGYDYFFFTNLSFTSSFVAPIWAIISVMISFIAKKIRKEDSLNAFYRKNQTIIIEH